MEVPDVGRSEGSQDASGQQRLSLGFDERKWISNSKMSKTGSEIKPQLGFLEDSDFRRTSLSSTI
ncbi:MAG: hypothetical protein H6821_05200 [Planctomycetaceae bacterium]|nr:hypothetical protein [Planctomycetaceae bacterium]